LASLLHGFEVTAPPFRNQMTKLWFANVSPVKGPNKIWLPENLDFATSLFLKNSVNSLTSFSALSNKRTS
jgi:hypothetical protein